MRQFTTQAKLFVFILSSLWLSPNKILAQLTLEATYPTTDLRRIQLPVSGEKWYYADDSTRKIYLFNANHTPWKTVNYPSETNKTVKLDAMNRPVSETTFNSDGLLEFVWRFKDSTGQFVKILNERNELVYNFGQGVNVLTVNELSGSLTKLFVESGNYDHQKTAIFSLPIMVLDTIFDYAGDMQRRKFSYAGEKFYFKNRNTNFLEILNPNYTRWKSFKIHNTRNELKIKDDIFFVDDGLFSSDSSVGCMFRYRHGTGDSLSRIVDKNGRDLLSANSRSRFTLDIKGGLPNKLFFDYEKDINAYVKYRVYSLSKIRYETTYTLPTKRITLKHSGVKYVSFGYKKVDLTDASHSNLQTIKFIPSSGYIFSNDFDKRPLICDSIVNQDTLLEAIWIERKDGFSNLRITTENGINLAIIPNASHFQINQFDNLPNKLVTKISNGFKDFETKVWRFSTRTPVSYPSVQRVFDAQISPNPFSNAFTINVLGNDRPLSIRLFNTVGGLVFSEKMTTNNATFTPPNGLPQGVYWCQISDGKSQVVKKLVKMN